MPAVYLVFLLHLTFSMKARSMNTDQTALLGAVWSGSIMFSTCSREATEVHQTSCLFLSQNICSGYLKEPSQWDGSFEHPKHKLKIMVRKYLQFYTETFVYLNNGEQNLTPVILSYFACFFVMCWLPQFISPPKVPFKICIRISPLLNCFPERIYWKSQFWKKIADNFKSIENYPACK